jgi:uncharacterized protein (TIGR00106 family)
MSLSVPFTNPVLPRTKMKLCPLNFRILSDIAAVEGSWTEVMTVIGQAHSLLHSQGIFRIQTDIRIGSRTDKSQTMEDKVSAVEKLLSSDK